MASNRSKRRRAGAFAQPVIDFGDEAKGGIRSLLEEMMGLLRDPSQIRDNPEYQFLQSEGLRGVSQMFGAKGKGISGQAIRGGQKFGQGLASTFLSQMLQRRGGVLQGLFQQYNPGAQASMQMSQFVGNQQSGGGGSALGGLMTIGGAVVGGMYGGPAGAAAGASIGSSIGGMFGGPATQSVSTQQYPQQSFTPFYQKGSGMFGAT